MPQQGAGEALEHLEIYLRDAHVRFPKARPFQGSPHRGLLLDGGATALAIRKADGDRGASAEAAAWEVAKLLGWTDLLSPTVLRRLPPADGAADVLHAVRLALHGVHTHAPLTAFSDEDVWRAAAFDYMVFTTDRHGGNYLAMELIAGRPFLSLIDHEHAFDLPGRPFQSELFESKRADPVPDWVKHDVARFIEAFPGPVLGGLLSANSLARLEERAKKLRDCQTLGELAP